MQCDCIHFFKVFFCCERKIDLELLSILLFMILMTHMTLLTTLFSLHIILCTSGLDATSSMELLYHLDLLAKSGRTVILTIHQPRMEIFHMFDKLVLLSDGKVYVTYMKDMMGVFLQHRLMFCHKVAYHGAPEKAYEVFVSALLRKRLNYSSLKEQNPAGTCIAIVLFLKVQLSLHNNYH